MFTEATNDDKSNKVVQPPHPKLKQKNMLLDFEKSEYLVYIVVWLLTESVKKRRGDFITRGRFFFVCFIVQITAAVFFFRIFCHGHRLVTAPVLLTSLTSLSTASLTSPRRLTLLTHRRRFARFEFFDHRRRFSVRCSKNKTAVVSKTAAVSEVREAVVSDRGESAER